MHRGVLAGLLMMGAFAESCEGERERPHPQSPSSAKPAAAGLATSEVPVEPPDSTEASPPPAAAQPEPADPPAPEPAFAVARAALRVFATPSFSAAFRGQIPRDQVFTVIDKTVDGDAQCRRGWAKLGPSAFACLDRAEDTQRRPAAVPEIPDGRLLPFVYFRRNKREPQDAEAPGIWRSVTALRRGDEPIDSVQKHRDYAFAKRRRGRGGPFLVDRNRNAVREKEVERLEPSDFSGRDLTEDPIPDDVTLAWSVHWPHTTVYAEARESSAELNPPIAYHETLYLTGDSQRRGRLEFWKVASDSGGWVLAQETRRFEPFEAPTEVASEERWLDVDLSQQTLTVMQGSSAVFVTLVSTGSWKNPTPTGLFRLISKHGLDDMRSRPDEADPYTVEGVPWAQYFDGRYGLHGTYWHNRFGMRTSHGCVNLSALDARHVFEQTSPAMPQGWMTVYEHDEDLGTLVRIRKGPEHPPDERASVMQRRRSDYRSIGRGDP